MINTLKNFTKKKIAGLILILVIIIAFGFGGFGGGFDTGNQNNIAKINNTNISTQDFMEYLNRSGLSQQVIKKNIDKNVLEELLSALISKKLLEMEIKDLNLSVSEDILIKKIKKNKNFQDVKGKFQRTIYEKFLITNNLNAAMYEVELKNNILQKQLFTYISGGTKSPNFLIDKYYKEKNRKVSVKYINLNDHYRKKENFTDEDIKLFVKENTNNLKQDYIDFSYIIITPKNLTGLDEFTQTFFDKIDEIENKISKNIDFKTIINQLNIKEIVSKDYINLDNKETVENKIYNFREKKTEILEDNGNFIFYNIEDINNKLPNLDDAQFTKQIKNLLFQKNKFEFNKKILDQISKKEFDQLAFDKLGKNKIENIKINSIKDNEKFTSNSIEIIYSLPINAFTMIANDKNDIYVAKIVNYEEKNISQNSDLFTGISNEASAQNRNGILKSYDYLLSNKYKVIVIEKTLDRVKNYFR